MGLPNVDVLSNKLSVKERWLKLYRKVFNLFLQFDLVHVVDFRLMLEQLNIRMAAIEANMIAGDAQVAANATVAINTLATGVQTQMSTIYAQMASHTHSYVSPGGPALTLPATGVPSVSTFQPPIVPAPPTITTGKVQYTDVALKARNTSLLATGKAIAPLSLGTSIEEQKANVEILTDVGF